MSFAYKGTFVVDHTKVPSTQSNFPVLISVTDNTLKTIANGGQMQSANGYDFRPYSDSGFSSALTFQLVYYNGSTGQIILRVLIASLSSSSDTTIYCGFGDASLTTDASSTSVWDSNYVVTYSFGDGTTLSRSDGTSHANSFVDTGTGFTAGTGQVKGCATTDGVADAGNSTNNVTFSGVNFTVGTWIKRTSTAGGNGAGFAEQRESGGSTGRWALIAGSSSNTTVYSDKNGFQNGSVGFADNTWTHLTFVNTAGDCRVYINGALVDTLSPLLDTGSFQPPTNALHVGWTDTGAAGLIGSIDEWKVSDTNRAASWVTTEYNNENNPAAGGFFTSITFASNGGSAPLGSNYYRHVAGIGM